MAVFSTNQVRQLYVVKGVEDYGNELANVGDISVGADENTPETSIWFSYKGVDGLTRTDIINSDKVIKCTKTSASSMKRSLSRYKVIANPDVHTTNAVAGQDYILRIAFRNYIGLSDSDQYFKYGMVHATSTTTISDLYRDLALSLAKNFSKDEAGLLSIYLETNGTDLTAIADTELVTASNVKDDLIDTYTGVVIEEKEQDWVLGVKELTSVNFSVLPTLITVNGDDVIWGEASKNIPDDTKYIGNGKMIADLEYFCMGERGDIYRNIGWPKVVKTSCLVDPSEEYDVIDIHYYFEGSGENPQKSEKTITLVGNESDITTLYTTLSTYINI